MSESHWKYLFHEQVKSWDSSQQPGSEFDNCKPGLKEVSSNASPGWIVHFSGVKIRVFWKSESRLIWRHECRLNTRQPFFLSSHLQSIVVDTLWNTVKASYFGPQENVEPFSARSVASLGEFCAKNEKKRTDFANRKFVYNFYCIHFFFL